LTGDEFDEMFAGSSPGSEGSAARGRGGVRGLQLSWWTTPSSP